MTTFPTDETITRPSKRRPEMQEGNAETAESRELFPGCFLADECEKLIDADDDAAASSATFLLVASLVHSVAGQGASTGRQLCCYFICNIKMKQKKVCSDHSSKFQ